MSIFTVQWRDLSERTELEAVDATDCETCAATSVPGVEDPATGIGCCTGCTLEALALGVVRIIAKVPAVELVLDAAPLPTECGICGRAAADPYRRTIADGTVVEGCVAPIHPADAWTVGYRLEALVARLRSGESAGAVHSDVTALAAVASDVDLCRDARNIGCRLGYAAGRAVTPGAGHLSTSAYIDVLVRLAAEARATPSRDGGTHSVAIAR